MRPPLLLPLQFEQFQYDQKPRNGNTQRYARSCPGKFRFN